MPKITYNTHDNKTHTIDVQNGLTVMEGAIQNDIPGIDADCGGEGCHAQLVMYMLMKIGWISYQLKKMGKKICWIWRLNPKKIVD